MIKASFINKIENATIIRSIREGLVSIIPILTIGALALILKTFPITAYQTFLSVFLDGFLLKILDFIYSATFGVLSVYMTISISRAYMSIKADKDAVHIGAVFAALLSFFVVSGANLEDFGTGYMGPKSIFLAILTGLGASALYLCLEKFLRSKRKTIFSPGANRNFTRMISTFIPIALTSVAFALANALVVYAFGVDSIRVLLSKFFDWLFSFGSTGFFKGLLFVFLSSVLWFFGIHGSDTLEGVMEKYFTPGLAINQEAILNGGTPNVILTKGFFDCFVLMGGCGSTICLLIAILLFSRNRARRGLGLTATFPMIFNINELMVFGLPIILNPIMLIPFLLVPIVCYSVAYLALSIGLVPLITNAVEWTTPIILGGFRATGSFAGALLQIVNVILGVSIYSPFVRLLDKRTQDEAMRNYNSFVSFFKENESSFVNNRILELNDVNGQFAKGLCAELKHDLDKSGVVLAYQPQYNYENECVGAEALLRWKHPVYGVLYPPLVVKLAEEGGFLPSLEEKVVKQVLIDRPKVVKHFGENIKISFNITGTTVTTERFIQFCKDLNEKESFIGKNLCLEVTEQATLKFDEQTTKNFNEIRQMGLLLAIDDFSMGQTSLNYLKDNMFDVIKLDGSLVRGLFTHMNCREIISSIVNLSNTLNLVVIAEYVETKEEKEVLHEIGCDCYQGYLYSPAVFINDFDQKQL